MTQADKALNAAVQADERAAMAAIDEDLDGVT